VVVISTSHIPERLGLSQHGNPTDFDADEKQRLAVTQKLGFLAAGRSKTAGALERNILQPLLLCTLKVRR
jgi:hypothetical protein